MNNNTSQTLKSLLLGAVIMLLVMPQSFAQESVSLSLQQALDFGVKNAYSVKSTRYDAEIANLTTRELTGIGLPQINGTASFMQNIYTPVTVIPAGTFGPNETRVKFQQPFNFSASATASQLLFDGTWLVGLQAAKSYEDLQKKTVNKSEVQLKNEITKAYYLALVSAENMRLLEESKQSLMVTYRETEALYNAGFTEKDNVDQLSLTLNDLTIQAKYAEEQFKLTKDLLKFQIGMPLANDITLSDSAENLMSTDAGALLSSAFQPESTLDVQLAHSGLGMQQLNLRAKKAAYLPSVSTYITFQTTAQRGEFNFFDSSKQYFYGNFWGVQMSVPILSGGRRATAVKKVEVEVKRMEDMLDLAKQGAELEYRSAKAELDNAIQVYNSSKSSVLLASNILKNAQIKFKEGIGTSFDVTQRNTQSIQAQGAYVGAMLKVLNAKTRLAKSLNQL